MIIDEKAYLNHSGVKGMKWGTRKDQKKEQKQQKKIKREDAKWTAALLGKPSFSGQRHDIKIWNMAAASMNSGIQQKINNKYPGDLTKDPKRMAAYHKETAEAMTKELNKVLGKVPGGAVSPSGSIKAVIRVDPNTLTPYVSFHKTNVQHGNLEDFRIKLKVSKTGHILGFIIPDLNLSQSNLFDIDEFIAHYGTKGMKWGVRRAEKKNAKKDFKWAAKLGYVPNNPSGFLSTKETKNIWNASANAMNSGIQDRINAKYPGDLTKDPKRRKQYYKEVAQAMNKELNKALNNSSLGPTSPSGKYTAEIRVDHNTLRPYAVINHTKEVKHSSEELIIDLKVSKTGHILSFIIPDLNLSQSNLFDIDEFIAHYGTKGMRWRNRSGKQKLLMIGAGVAGFEAANYALRRKRISFLTHLGVSLASATAAVAATQAILDREGAKRVSTF